MESFILRKEQDLTGESREFLFAVGSAGIEDFGDAPVMIGARRDEVPIHGPVVVFAGSTRAPRVVIRALADDWAMARDGMWDAGKVAAESFRRGRRKQHARARALPLRGADVQLVEAFDGRIQGHTMRKAGILIEWKGKDGEGEVISER